MRRSTLLNGSKNFPTTLATKRTSAHSLGIDTILRQYKQPKLDPSQSSDFVAPNPNKALADKTTEPADAAGGTSCSTSKPTQEGSIRRPVNELPTRFRHVFPYLCFNQVQSIVYDTVLDSNKSIVVSAPTGSGKTGIFELAIIKVIMDAEQRRTITGAAKIIYLAPTKALCTERRLDWDKKFGPFNIQCIELTSDFQSAINFKDIQKSSILLATPEKWDSVTRSWNGNRAFVQSIRLLLIDEVHLVNDGLRGATLEAVVSRMKTIRSVIWPTEPDNLRFIAVSATVSNVQDIAQWLSSERSDASVFQVDHRERPVKLRTIVLGYSASVNVNEFSFDNLLNHKLAEVIKEYSNDKPTLVFCATRKSASNAATTLTKEGRFDMSFSVTKRKLYVNLAMQLKDKTLQDTVRFGIAFHHAGLSMHDRRLIEEGFIDGRIMILCCTSTLAMGVNLPAHLVIIKNTSHYDEGRFKPYSESSIVQMIGRAGRPQYDTEATAVIMTKSFCRDEIEKMLTGRMIVDSQLHKFLTEHLNSEVVLGTITGDTIARKWIDSTYLKVRLSKNPENYGLRKGCPDDVKETTLMNWCSKSIELLLKHKLIVRNEQGQLESTDAGRAMARHYICLSTMISMTQLKGDETVWDLIQMICACHEVASDLQLRLEDKPTLTRLCNETDEENKLRYPLGDKIYTREKKAAALIQAAFGNLSLTDSHMIQETQRILRNAGRVMGCLRDLALIKNDMGYKTHKNLLMLAQCFAATLWNDSIYVSKQLEKIGPILSKNLAANGLTTFETLRNAEPRNIEMFCNRLSPFGSNVQQTCFGLPIYGVKTCFRALPGIKEKIQLIVEVTIINGQDLRSHSSLPGTHGCFLLVGSPKNDCILLRQYTNDRSILSRPDMTVCVGCDLDKSVMPDDGSEIETCLISELFVGLDVRSSTRYSEPEEDIFN